MSKRETESGRLGLVLWIVLGVVVLGIASLAVLLSLREPEVAVKAEEKAVPVNLMPVEPRTLEDVIMLPGRIEAAQDVVLGPDKSGRIVALEVDEGDRVEAGQLLLRIDDRLWETSRRRAAIELREAEKDWARWQALARSGGVSTSELDTVRTRLDQAQVAVQEAETHVAQCRMESPIDGIVDERYVDPGEYAQEGMPAFRIVDASRVDVVFDVPEQDIGSVTEGLAVPLRVQALPGGAFTGTVSFVAVAGGAGSNAFRTEAEVDNRDGALRPGMIARVRLHRGTLDDAVVVPLAAVIARRGEHVVFVADGDRAERRVVEIARIIGREAVLGSGVAEGDRVVIEGHRTLQDGALLDVRASAEPTEAVGAGR